MLTRLRHRGHSASLFLCLLFCPSSLCLSACLHQGPSLGLWPRAGLPLHSSRDLKGEKQKTHTIIKEAAAENEVHSFAFRAPKFISVHEENIGMGKAQNEADEQVVSEGVFLLALSWDRGVGKRRVGCASSLLSQAFSPSFYFVSPDGPQAISRLGRCGGCA